MYLLSDMRLQCSDTYLAELRNIDETSKIFQVRTFVVELAEGVVLLAIP